MTQLTDIMGLNSLPPNKTDALKAVIRQIEGVLNEKGRNHYLVYMERPQAEAVHQVILEELYRIELTQMEMNSMDRIAKTYKDGEI